MYHYLFLRFSEWSGWDLPGNKQLDGSYHSDRVCLDSYTTPQAPIVRVKRVKTCDEGPLLFGLRGFGIWRKANLSSSPCCSLKSEVEKINRPRGFVFVKVGRQSPNQVCGDPA